MKNYFTELKHQIILPGVLILGCFLFSACSKDKLRNTAQIYVTTDPENANLFCDSAACGSTPATITSVVAGKHILTVRKPGYRETRATVTIKSGDRLAVELKLEHLRGLALIHSVPSGADVEIEGVNIGKTPLFSCNFPPGQNRLQISKPGYIPKSVNVNIEDRTPIKVDVNLTSDSAELTVESSPSGAAVTMNNAVIGTTPLKLTDAKTGKHTIKMTLKGHLPVQREIELQAGEKQKISSRLIPLPGKLTILSVPSKARVYLNNQFKSETPFNATNITSGKYVIRVEKQGYDSQTQTNHITFGEKTTVEFRLVKSSGRMIISTLPPGVNVYLDGELRGTTKARGHEQISEQFQIDFVTRGQHQLQFTKKGYINIQRSANIMPKQNLLIYEKLSLRPVPFVPDVIIRTGDKPEQTFKGIIRDTFANGDIKMEIESGIFKIFNKSEIISKETIPSADSNKNP